MAQPALRLVGVGEDGGRRGGEHGRGLVVDVEDGARGEPAALGEDKVSGYLQASPLVVPGPLHLEEEGP